MKEKTKFYIYIVFEIILSLPFIAFGTYIPVPNPIVPKIKVECAGETATVSPINGIDQCPLFIALGETATFSDAGSYDYDSCMDGTQYMSYDTMKAIGWSLFIGEGTIIEDTGSLEYTFDDLDIGTQYYARATVDDLPAKADDSAEILWASVKIIHVDYIVVINNPVLMRPGESRKFFAYAFNKGPDGEPYYDEHLFPIFGRPNDDIAVAATFTWLVIYEEFGTVDPTQDSNSTTFTADLNANGPNSVCAAYTKQGEPYIIGIANVLVNNWNIQLTDGDGNEIPNIPFNTPNDDTVNCAVTVTDGPANSDLWVELRKYNYMGATGDISISPTSVRVVCDENGSGTGTFNITSSAKSTVLDDISIEVVYISGAVEEYTYDATDICVFEITKSMERAASPQTFDTGNCCNYSDESYDHVFGGFWACPGIALAGGGWDNWDSLVFMNVITEAKTPNANDLGGLSYDNIRASLGFTNEGTKVLIGTSPEYAFQGTVDVALRIRMDGFITWAKLQKPKWTYGSGSVGIGFSRYVGGTYSFSWQCSAAGTCHGYIKFGTEQPEGQAWSFRTNMMDLLATEKEFDPEDHDIEVETGSNTTTLPKEYQLIVEVDSAANRNDVRYSAHTKTKCEAVYLGWLDDYPNILTHY